MKKVLFIAAAVAAMAACTKSEVVYDDNDTEIGLAPVNYMTTKTVYGPYETNSYNPYENFNVFAVYTTQDKGTRFDALVDAPTDYLTNVVFANRNNTVWGGSPTAYYWPKSGSLYFAGYSPSEVPQSSTTEIKCSFTMDKGSVISIPNFLQGAYAYKNGTETTNPTDYKMVDLMYFDVAPASVSGNKEGEDGYPVLFKHSLSWLTFKFGVANDYGNGLYIITKVTLKNVAQCASFTSGAGDVYDGCEKPDWKNHTSASDIVLFDKDKNSGVTDNALVFTNGKKFVIDDVLVIPQSIPGQADEATIEIVYEQKPYAGATEVAEVTITKPLTGGLATDDTDNDISQWVINKHYTYNITFTNDEILIAPTVDSWDKVDRDFNI